MNKKPWPTKAAMEQIYELNLWGGEPGSYHSGFGSHDKSLVEPYMKVIHEFVSSLEYKPTILDLGCGDFNIGKEIAPLSKTYIGIDIAENLIKRNQQIFLDDKVEFHCLDIARDPLPSADVVLLRHVLQHLSNGEVQQILNKLSAFEHVIITEHLPEGDFEPNKDIISGQGTRLKKQSGIVISEPPFSFSYKEERKLLSISDNYGVIKTVLYCND